MNETIIKSAAASLLVVSLWAPFSASAETLVTSGSGATASMSAYNGSLWIHMSVFEEATRDKTGETTSAGVSMIGRNYTGSACWRGNSTSYTIDDFKVAGFLPMRIVASGTAHMEWDDVCGPNTSFDEEVTFSVNLIAMTDQAESNRGTTHSAYGATQINYHFNWSNAPAYASTDSYILSPAFGSAIIERGKVGQSKEHVVEIIK